MFILNNQDLVLRPEYKSSDIVFNLIRQLDNKIASTPQNYIQDDGLADTDTDSVNTIQVNFDEDKFYNLLETHYTDDIPFDSDKEWEIIMKDNSVLPEESNSNDDDLDYYSDDYEDDLGHT